VAVAAWAVARGPDRPASAVASEPVVHTVRAPLAISTSATLMPDPGHEQPALTAAQAWQRWQAANRGRVASVPSGTTVYLGLLTTDSVVDRLSYAYRSGSPTGCAVVGGSPPPGTSPTPAASPTPCLQWVVLDATNGRELVEEQTIDVAAPS
jgi:hypothetical protein